MKQKLFTFFLTLLSSVSAIYASNTQEASTKLTKGGIWYEVDKSTKTASVTYKGTTYVQYDEYSGSVTIPETVTFSDGTTYRVTSIGYSAFRECSDLTSVTIGNSVISIGEDAFSNCNRLISVIIGESVTSIGDGAFSDCTRLPSVTIPNNVKSIGNYAFFNCDLTSVTIGKSVTRIGESAFKYCFDLTSVTIGESVTSIGNSAFYYCSSLTSVTIPNSVKSIEYAFAGCSSLTEVHISDIAAWCEIDFVGSDANPLYYAKNLYLNGELVTDLVIPNSVKSIGNNAFYNCYPLTSITIPNSVTSIGYSAFRNCSDLTSVTIGESVEFIDDNAFYGCSSLTTVICEAIDVPWLGGDHVFYNMPLSEATLYVPAQSLDDYKIKYIWRDFGTILPLEEHSADVEEVPLFNSNNSPQYKILHNNQLLILRDGKTYNVMGQEL